jgi:pyruvate dehydrogenase E1 component beta subunit
VDQGTLTGGFAGEIVARVTEQAFDALKAAPIRVTLPDIPTPTTRALSNYYYPTPGHIVAAVRRVLGLVSDEAHGDPWAGIAPEDKSLDVPDKSFSGPF